MSLSPFVEPVLIVWGGAALLRAGSAALAREWTSVLWLVGDEASEKRAIGEPVCDCARDAIRARAGGRGGWRAV